MPGNFGAGVVSHAPQGRIHRCIAHRPALASRTRKEEAGMPTQRMQFAQDHYCLRCQRHKVLSLGLGRQIFPLGLVQVELLPARLSKFAHVGRCSHCCDVSWYRRRQCPAKIAGRITFGAAGCHGIAENLSTVLLRPVCGI
jgi:hypothetical protein